MMWSLRYYQHGVLYEHEADTKEEAIRFGAYGQMDGKFSMRELLSPDGEVVMNNEQLEKYVDDDPDLKWHVSL